MDELNWLLIAAKSWAAKNNAVITKLEKKPNGDWMVTGKIDLQTNLGEPPEPDPEE
jgi:hypothetical protein